MALWAGLTSIHTAKYQNRIVQKELNVLRLRDMAI